MADLNLNLNMNFWILRMLFRSSVYLYLHRFLHRLPRTCLLQTSTTKRRTPWRIQTEIGVNIFLEQPTEKSPVRSANILNPQVFSWPYSSASAVERMSPVQ